MTNQAFRHGAAALACGISAIALTTSLAFADSANSAAARKINSLKSNGTYLSGDKHNHTTCTDGAMAVQTVVNESLITYELDWFAQTGHGGNSPRDCRFDDPEYNGSLTGSGDFWWNTVGVDALKGDPRTSNGNGSGTAWTAAGNEGDAPTMWRWQELNEYAFPLQSQAGQLADKPAWLGIEHNAPGHEHVSMAVTTGQFGKRGGDPYHTGQFNYLWDRGDQEDASGGDEYDFESPANRGVEKTFGDTTGLVGHEKTVRAVEWLADNFGAQAYYVPAHVERQGGFVSDANRGWNVEHFRNVHTAGLLNPRRPFGESIVFGAEMLAGHQFANGGRGTYEADRPTAGFGTYGGAGAYSGAEVSVAGFDFDGNPITNATLTAVRDELNALFEDRLTEPSGSDQYDQLDACSDCSDPAPAGIGTSQQERFVLGRPGLSTMWDALLGEGRRFFNFGSSDWHNRGQFGPFEPQSTLDPWPGEYNKIWAYADGGYSQFGRKSTKAIIEGMRSGNSWSSMGDVINEFYFVMCQRSRCATMGETLKVLPGRGAVTWMIKIHDPEGKNNSPYQFDNPSLLQLGLNVPIDEPILSHIDIIRGDITGMIDENDPAYETNVSNPTVELFGRIFNELGAQPGEFEEVVEDGKTYLVATGRIPSRQMENDMYFRVRGTNMPVGTPNETDADGNPVLDDFAGLIPCTATGAQEGDPQTDPVFAATGSSFNVRNQVNAVFDPLACPAHLPVDANGVKFLDADVEAWTDLWFYANPIFVEVQTPRSRQAIWSGWQRW